MHTKGRDDFGQFIQEYLRLLVLFEHENDVVCIFQIDKVFSTGYLNTRALETFQRSSHDFIDHEFKQEWGEWALLTDTRLCSEAFGDATELLVRKTSHPHGSKMEVKPSISACLSVLPIMTPGNEQRREPRRLTFLLSFGQTFTANKQLWVNDANPTCETAQTRNYEQPLTNLIFTVEDIRQLSHKINPFCKLGLDEVHLRILKETSSTLANHLHLVFRQSLDEGRLPPAWKEAIVTPIYKTGDRLSPGSYRPISLTSVPCKGMERILKQAIPDRLTPSNLTSPAQHGFLPNRSCVTNMLVFMDSLTQTKDEGLISDAIFFDFSKAFDRVTHVPLLHKLESYGIQGKIVR
ncbi:hypothetical protein T265_04970 [Opisthorchis viverrini]|uniref:Reverse transcriptase domain-containing protein n=1 Tax=Opisthorchis viverrini TaxID=6198 RepID=A0A075AFW7_OPIVI|nr:hypothetical protein T265_04970 [Opisthorchis viverrini]KER28139.1 hypothetical protein T265_04970 [Opisthorchis viverrini]